MKPRRGFLINHDRMRELGASFSHLQHDSVEVCYLLNVKYFSFNIDGNVCSSGFTKISAPASHLEPTVIVLRSDEGPQRLGDEDDCTLFGFACWSPFSQPID